MSRRLALFGALACTSALFVAAAPAAHAQRALDGQRFRAMPFPQPNLYPPGYGATSARAAAATAGARPAILLTGYWPPTNEMVRHFSTDPVQNPGGWQGSNWEGRGYDVYSYFAEFPNGGGQGTGDLEVDYQDTSADFWPIADGIQPIAVITFSRGFLGSRWELEWINRNHSSWVADYTAPTQPTPSPPDGSVPAGHIRNSTLPVQDILDAVDVASLPTMNAYIDFNGGGGGFLSEFIAYHGVWYQSLHENPLDPAWCVAAGHVHVGSTTPLVRARRATHQTLRAVMRYVDEVMAGGPGHTEWFCPTTSNSVGPGAVLTAIGSHSITQNDLQLTVVEAVPNNPGLAFYGPSRMPAAPFGDGVLCVAAPHNRVLRPVFAGPNGYAHAPLDFTQPPMSSGAGQITAGSRWHFQYWLRDPAAGGTGFTTSSGLSLTFAP